MGPEVVIVLISAKNPRFNQHDSPATSRVEDSAIATQDLMH